MSARESVEAQTGRHRAAAANPDLGPPAAQPPGTAGEDADVAASPALPRRGPGWFLARSLRVLWCLAVRGLLVVLALSIVIVGTLRWVDPPASSFMLRQAWVSSRLGREPPYYFFHWVPIEEIAPEVRLAVLASEDQRFPDHPGFDAVEIRKAIETHRRGGALRGASTITQQTAKNLLLWPEGSWLRKLPEAWLTVLMELLWSKERILEIYLNIAQFSASTYGVAAASERYFHRPVSRLGLREGALLAGVLPAPATYRLDRPSARLRRRAAWIEDQARRLGGVRYLKRL